MYASFISLCLQVCLSSLLASPPPFSFRNVLYVCIASCPPFFLHTVVLYSLYLSFVIRCFACPSVYLARPFVRSPVLLPSVLSILSSSAIFVLMSSFRFCSSCLFSLAIRCFRSRSKLTAFRSFVLSFSRYIFPMFIVIVVPPSRSSLLYLFVIDVVIPRFIYSLLAVYMYSSLSPVLSTLMYVFVSPFIYSCLSFLRPLLLLVLSPSIPFVIYVVVLCCFIAFVI